MHKYLFILLLLLLLVHIKFKLVKTYQALRNYLNPQMVASDLPFLKNKTQPIQITLKDNNIVIAIPRL